MAFFLTILDLFVCPIKEYSPTFCFVGVNWEKKRKQAEKKQKRGKCNSLCRDISFVRRDAKFKQAKGTMSQPATKCLNKGQT